MALQFQRSRVSFDPTRGRVQTEPRTVSFQSRVRTAHVALNGFDVRYNNGDHHVLEQTIDISDPTIANNAVSFSVNLLLRDASGNIDDPFSGWVDVLVIADTV